MKRSSVRAFVKTGVDSITPTLEFGAGLVTDFNSIRSHDYPATWLVQEKVDSEELSKSAPQDAWPIKLIIGQKDSPDSKPGFYEDIVDTCDEIAQKLTYKYRAVVSGYKLITMTGISRQKFIKKYADCITGVELSFTINAPDQSDFVC